MKVKNSRIYLTHKERILLHLLGYIDSISETDLPNAIIQPGIAEAVGIRWSHVPQAVKGLKKNGLIREIMGYVKGMKRKRKAYILTTEGILQAQELKESIETKDILLKDLKGKLSTMKLSEVSVFLKNYKLSLLEIIRYTSADGIFDLKNVRVKIIEAQRKYIDFAKKIPKLKYFFDRKQELKRISEWVESDKPKIIIIKGIAGIGKTTLITKLISEFKLKNNVFWYQIRGWSSLKDIIRQLSEFMSKMDKNKLNIYINSKQTINLIDILTILERDLNETNSILVFDDIHTANRNIQEFFSSLIDILEPINNVKFIIMGRYIPDFYNRKDVKITKLVSELELSGLDEEGSSELRKARNFDYLEFKKIYELTKGHPLFLELIESVENKKINTDLQKYIQEEIFTKLDEKEKKLLEIISVFRQPVKPEAFFIQDEINYETLDKLIKKSLVQVGIHSKYDLHDYIREFLYNRLTPQIKKEYHKNIAPYYLQEKDDLSSIEAQYHYLKANELKKAAELVTKKGAEIIKNGFLEEFIMILNEFEEKMVTSEQWACILLFKGDIHRILGEWDKSLEYYQNTLKITEILKEKTLIMEAYCNIGQIYFHRCNWSSAMENLEKSIKISESINDSERFTETNYWLAAVYSRQGKYSKAIVSLEKVLKDAKKNKDISMISRGCMGFGLVYMEKGQYRKAIDYYNKCIEILEKNDDLYEMAKMYNNLGETFKLKGDVDNAIEYYEKGIELSKRLGDIRVLGYGLINASEMYANTNILDKAKIYLDEALKISKKLDDKFMNAVAYMNYGIVNRYKKDWDMSIKYFEDSIKIMKELDLLIPLGDTYHEYGLMLKDKGDLKKARDELSKSLEIYKKLDNKTLIDKVEIELNEIINKTPTF